MLPLAGLRVVVTRAPQQAGDLGALLSAAGAEVFYVPVIGIAPPSDPEPLRQAAARVESYDWLIFTSVNGVRYFIQRLDRSGHDLRKLRARICAIGPATRAAIEALHLKADVMAKEYVAEGLLAALEPFDLQGKRMLLPRAAAARDVVPTELRRRGATVDVVEAYRTVVPEGTASRIRELWSRKPDCVTFTSSSTVRNFVEAAGPEILQGVAVATIGPITSQTARELGIPVTAQADVYTIDGLLEAVLQVCRRQPARHDRL